MRLCLRAKTQHDDDDYKVEKADAGEEANYYMQAHSVREIITSQATIMVNGMLKEYQVALPSQYTKYHFLAYCFKLTWSFSI